MKDTLVACEVKLIEYKSLKLAFITVKDFLEEEARRKVPSLKTKIAADLGIYGDDNHHLLINFVEKFKLGHDDFLIDNHFHSEGEIADFTLVCKNLIVFPVWLALKSFEILTLNLIKLKKPSFYNPSRKVIDLTLKDLITWYIEGTYKTYPIKYKIDKTL